jgi:hypothetical protein
VIIIQTTKEGYFPEPFKEGFAKADIPRKIILKVLHQKLLE